ncbi:MAG: class I SAM-dependent methyltransferase [Kiritimatiellae bacterium]|nr:class I SAM-dependent methyltransferase [Kiritimatiellia bacterium]
MAPSLAVSLGGCPGYELLDSGDRYKLERFGPVTVIRGEPKAWWRPALPRDAWNRADAIHEEGSGWTFPNRKCPREWTLSADGLTFLLRFSDASKHLGLFPEQSPHWRAIARVAALPRPPGAPPPRLINLFGYTGAATLVAAKAGFHATHVDASKPAIAWARENQNASRLADRPVRWILEDAVKYVRRELNRGSRYDAILLDPPAFGRGPGGGVWKVEHHLCDLLSLCAQLLTDHPLLLLLTTYNIEASALMLHNLLSDLLPPGRITSGELALPHASTPSRLLPLSIYSSWSPA